MPFPMLESVISSVTRALTFSSSFVFFHGHLQSSNFFQVGLLSALVFATRFIVLYHFLFHSNFPFWFSIISVLWLFFHVIIHIEFHMFNFFHVLSLLLPFFIPSRIVIYTRFSVVFKFSLWFTGRDFSKGLVLAVGFLLSCLLGFLPSFHASFIIPLVFLLGYS